MTTFITFFGNLWKLVHDRRISFMSADFFTFLLEFGITHAPRTKWSTWTNAKLQIQNTHLSRYFLFYLSEAGNNWAEFACQFASAHKTSAKSSTGTTPREIVSGFKPQVPSSLKFGLVWDDNDLCQSEICQSLPSHTHVNNETSHLCLDNLFSSKSPMDLLNRETQLKNICCKVYRKIGEANHRSLAHRNEWKLAKLLENLKLCELQSGPYIVTKLFTRVIYEFALDADPTRTQVVHRNHLVEFFPRDNGLPNFSSNYEKLVHDD